MTSTTASTMRPPRSRTSASSAGCATNLFSSSANALLTLIGVCDHLEGRQCDRDRLGVPQRDLRRRATAPPARARAPAPAGRSSRPSSASSCTAAIPSPSAGASTSPMCWPRRPRAADDPARSPASSATRLHARCLPDPGVLPAGRRRASASPTCRRSCGAACWSRWSSPASASPARSRSASCWRSAGARRCRSCAGCRSASSSSCAACR